MLQNSTEVILKLIVDWKLVRSYRKSIKTCFRFLYLIRHQNFCFYFIVLSYVSLGLILSCVFKDIVVEV